MKEIDIKFIKYFELIDRYDYEWRWTTLTRTNVGNTTYGVCDHYSLKR